MVSFQSILVAGSCLLAAVSAAPTASPVLKDIHDTKLNLYQAKNGHGSDYGHFAVRVERVDELLDVTDVKTETVAARISDIVVNFDVNANGDVQVNGQPVSVGMSNVKVHAKMMKGVRSHNVGNYTKQQIDQAFDMGVVNLAVHVAGATIKTEKAEFTRIIIAEQITEVNGKAVSQKALMQQVFEIHPGGQVLRGAPCSANHESAEALKYETSTQTRCRVVRFFRHMPFLARVGFSFMLGFIMIGLVRLFAILTARLFVRLFRSHKQQQTFTEENSPMIDKAGAKGDDEKLPVYSQSGYTPVASDEKKTPQ